MSSSLSTNQFVTIFGYGSLMNIESAMRTMPSLTNFRKGILYGYRREYSLVSISGLKNGAVEPYVAALAIRKVTDTTTATISSSTTTSNVNEKVIGCIFDIPECELEAYFIRESRYCRIQVEVTSYDECNNIVSDCVVAWTVIEQTDEDYRTSLLRDNKLYEQEVGYIYPKGQLWGRSDILPLPSYFDLVLHAANDLDRSHGISNIQNLNQLDNVGFKMNLNSRCVSDSNHRNNTMDSFNRNLSCVHNLLHEGYLADRTTSLYSYALRRISSKL